MKEGINLSFKCPRSTNGCLMVWMAITGYHLRAPGLDGDPWRNCNMHINTSVILKVYDQRLNKNSRHRRVMKEVWCSEEILEGYGFEVSFLKTMLGTAYAVIIACIRKDWPQQHSQTCSITQRLGRHTHMTMCSMRRKWQVTEVCKGTMTVWWGWDFVCCLCSWLMTSGENGICL